jgi:hypothetical protein
MYCSLVKVRWSGETLPILAWLYIFSLQLEKNCVCCASGFFFTAPAQKLGFSDFPENGAAQNHAFPHQFMTHLPAINMTSSQFLGESDGERQIEGPQLIPSTSPFGNGMEWTKKSQETC